MKLRYAPRAHADITHIYGYIALHNPRAAKESSDRFVRLLACWRDTLVSGGRPTFLTFASCRRLATPNLVYYRMGEREVTIVHVRDGRRAAP